MAQETGVQGGGRGGEMAMMRNGVMMIGETGRGGRGGEMAGVGRGGGKGGGGTGKVGTHPKKTKDWCSKAEGQAGQSSG